MDNDWAHNETFRADLWDPRCYNSLARICQKLAENAPISMSRVLGSLRKAMSRLCHHEKTTPQDLLRGHVRATAARCKREEFVLVATDTTYFNFSTHKAVVDLGPISKDPNALGFITHSALAITPEGVPLGVLYQDSWARDPQQMGQSEDRKERLLEDKESYKWIEALQGVQKALPKTIRALLVQDSEADIFDLFAAPRRTGIDLLVRVSQPHRIALTSDNQRSSVREAVLCAPVEAIKIITLPAIPGRKERQAQISIRRAFVQVQPPVHSASPKPAPLGLWVVAATEETPPEGCEAVEWILLTTLCIASVEAALLLVEHYVRRWLIERFHYVLKSGCQFERLQMDTLASLEKALSIYSIVAWRLLYLLYLSRVQPMTPAEEAISSREREILEQMQTKPVDTVADVVMAVAKLAGFRSSPSAPLPGIKSLWLGWRKLADIKLGYLLAKGRFST